MDIRGVAERVGPGVVGIGGRRGGSGVVVGAGRVVTLTRNVGGEAVDVYAGGERLAGRVLGRDDQADVGPGRGVAELDAASAWAQDGADVGIGTPVVALGDPAGRG